MCSIAQESSGGSDLSARHIADLVLCSANLERLDQLLEIATAGKGVPVATCCKQGNVNEAPRLFQVIIAQHDSAYTPILYLFLIQPGSSDICLSCFQYTTDFETWQLVK